MLKKKYLQKNRIQGVPNLSKFLKWVDPFFIEFLESTSNSRSTWCKISVWSSTVFALAVLIGRPSNRAEIPNLSKIFVHLSRKSRITRLFEPSCIYEPYNKRKLMNGVITWRWANTAKFPGSAARGRQS